MTVIPQLGPEVYIDDEDDIARPSNVPVSPLLSPMEIDDPRSSFISHGLGGAARHRAHSSVSRTGPLSPGTPGMPQMSPGVSPAISPQLSTHRPTNSNFSFDGGELGAAPGPASGGNSAQSSRRGSAVSAENVLEVLDNSAWGESIRKSFTLRRPNNRGDRGGSVS